MLLFNITGQLYSFAVGSAMRWVRNAKVQHSPDHEDGYFQLMPDTHDDGFFDWYCANRENEQFFEKKEHAALHFIYYWMEWEKLGKPQAF